MGVGVRDSSYLCIDKEGVKMNIPANIKEGDRVGTLVQIFLYFMAFIAIIYALYKLFGLFKDAGKHIEEVVHEAKEDLEDLNPSDAPGKFKQTAEDIWTMITKPGTPEGNAAKTRVHYGSPEYAPGNAPPVNWRDPVLKRYGQEVKPSESKTFAGGTYIEKDVNNMVKDPWGGYTTKEDALAHKYGFSTYAQFNAWLTGVKAALKAKGKDPSQMSLDKIVAYGRELEKKKEAYNKTHGSGTFDAYNSGTPAGAKPLPLPQSDELLRKVYPRTPGGGISIGYTPVIGGSPAARGLVPGDNGYIDIRREPHILPYPVGRKLAVL